MNFCSRSAASAQRVRRRFSRQSTRQNLRSALQRATPQRIVLELKDKIKNESLVNITSEAFSEEVPVANGEREEAANALVALGYSAAEANRAVSKVSADVSDVEGIIKSALKNLL